MSTETTNKKIKIDNGTTFGKTYTDKAIDAKLPTDLIATANKLSLGAGNAPLGNGVNLDGFTYDEATKTLKVNGGGGIPVVEGTIEELTEEEQSRGVVAKWTIPTAQSSNFIFYSTDVEGRYFMSYFEGIYSCNFNIPGTANYILYGTQTIIYLSNNTGTLNTIPYYVIDNFNDGDHNQSDFVMPTEDIVLFTDGSGTSLIGYKKVQNNVTFYFCYEWKIEIDGKLKKYKYLLYKISKSNVGYKIEIVDVSQAFNYNLMFLPDYTDSDNGKILAIDSGNPKWITSSSSSKTVSLFGRHSILAPLSSNDSDINLFWHNITSVNGNNQLLIQIYSSNNLSVKSLSDLATLVQGVYRKIIAGGIYENSPIFMIDWKGYASSVFYTVANPTTGISLSKFTTFEDDVIPV